MSDELNTATAEPSTALSINVESLKPADVFTPGGLDPILKSIEKDVMSRVPDVTTAKGRAEIASIAHRIARTKTAIDAMGKDLVADWKEKAKRVDNERAKSRDFLDGLKERYRKPLTDYEEAEKARLAKANGIIAELKAVIANPAPVGVGLESIADRIREVEEVEINTEVFEDDFDQAVELRSMAVDALKGAHAALKKREEERAELEKLRKEAAEREAREKAEREAKERAEAEAKRIAEAEERARKATEEKAAREKAEAERKAQEERDAAARREKLLQEEKQSAERRAKEAEERAKRDAEEAARRERERIEAEQKAKEEADAKRSADEAHRKAIIAESCQALIDEGVNAALAEDIINLIIQGDVPHVTINF